MKPKSGKSSKQPQEQPEPLSLDQKLQAAQASADRWNQVAASPSLNLPAALAARQLARSYGAATTLYQKALDNQKAENEPNPELMRVLGIKDSGINPSRLGQQPPSPGGNPPS
jgi:hypothetical protein